VLDVSAYAVQPDGGAGTVDMRRTCDLVLTVDHLRGELGQGGGDHAHVRTGLGSSTMAAVRMKTTTKMKKR
jgi:hypothetical protein